MNQNIKKAVNLRINKSLIDEAKIMKINLSQTLETSLIEIFRKNKENLGSKIIKMPLIATINALKNKAYLAMGFVDFDATV